MNNGESANDTKVSEAPFFDSQSSSEKRLKTRNEVSKPVTRCLWTVDDVARFLSVSARTVQDWVYRKKIPFRKAGKALRFAPEEIEQWTLA